MKNLEMFNITRRASSDIPPRIRWLISRCCKDELQPKMSCCCKSIANGEYFHFLHSLTYMYNILRTGSLHKGAYIFDKLLRRLVNPKTQHPSKEKKYQKIFKSEIKNFVKEKLFKQWSVQWVQQSFLMKFPTLDFQFNGSQQKWMLQSWLSNRWAVKNS